MLLVLGTAGKLQRIPKAASMSGRPASHIWVGLCYYEIGNGVKVDGRVKVKVDKGKWCNSDV